MSNRTLTIAVCLAVLTATLAWVTRPEPRGLIVTPSQSTGAFTLGIDVTSVSAVFVESGEYTASVAQRPEWLLSLPGEAAWPAEPNAVRAMLRDLASVRFEPREATEADTEPIARLGIDSLDVPGGRTITIDVLGPPLGGRLPVSITTPDGTRHADVPADRLRPVSIEDLAALAEPHPFTSEGVTTFIRITAWHPNNAGIGTDLQLARRAGVWSLESSGARLDQRAVESLVDVIHSIRMAGFVVEIRGAPLERRFSIMTASELPRAAGEPPKQVRCVLSIGDQANIEGDFEASVTRGAGEGKQSCQFTLDADTFPALPTTPDALLDPVPLPWPAGETATIEIATGAGAGGGGGGGGGQTVTFRRTLAGWTAQTGPADTRSIKVVLETLAAVHPVKLGAGSDAPVLFTLTLTPIGSGKPVTLFARESSAKTNVSDGASEWTVDETPLLDAINKLAG